MTREDINDIINAICPNDEDYEKPCISPKYLRQELEQLALDQKQWNKEPTTKNCRTCKNFGSHHGVCDICKEYSCFTEQEPTTKKDLAVASGCEVEDCISRKNILESLNGAFPSTDWNKALFRKIVLDSPSVYPKSETVTEFADRCRECGTHFISKSVLEDIKAEIQKLRNCSCSCSDGIIDDVEDIIESTKQKARIRNEQCI